MGLMLTGAAILIFGVFVGFLAGFFLAAVAAGAAERKAKVTV